MKPSEDNIQLAKRVAGAIGMEPHVYAYYDEEEKHMLHVLDCKDPLDNEIKFYCTIGVSDKRNNIEMKDGSFKNIPVEILMAGNRSTDKWGNIISTTGFYITKNGWPAQPGTIFKHIVNDYIPDTHLPHILFVTPFPWEDKLATTMHLDGKSVNFLLAMPVSEAESNFLEENGFSALEHLFEQSEVDYQDPFRPSVV